MIYGLGQSSSPEKMIDSALIARDHGADAVYCGTVQSMLRLLETKVYLL